MMLMATLRSTVAFFFLFLMLDLAFLCLAIGWVDYDVSMVSGAAMASSNVPLAKAGGAFGILAAFAAWYNAMAGVLDRGNR